MAKWPVLLLALPLAAGACLLPSLGELEGGRAADAGSDTGSIDSVAPDADAGGDAGSRWFFDDFNRPDGPLIGNGWLVKKPSSYELKGGTVRWLGGDPLSYRDHIVYRPSAEDRLDVMAQMTVTFSPTAASPNYPQIHVRVQSISAAIPDTLDSYLLYVDDSPTLARIARQRGSVFVTSLSAITISPQLTEGTTYRFSLSAVGTSPVVVTASIEALTAPSQWALLFKQTISDTDPDRITTAGAVGFSGGDGVAGVHTYDDFSTSAP